MKKRMNEKGLLVLIGIFGLVITGIAVYQYNSNIAYREKIENVYQKSFTELVDYVGNINIILNKALITNDSAELSELSEKLRTETALAKSVLGQLPLSSVELDKTSNFITQVSDYVHTLSKRLATDKTTAVDEENTIESFIKYSDSLNNSLKKMEDDFLYGNMSLSNEKAASVLSESKIASLTDNMKSIEDSFEDYPTIIYDGPFSEHILNKKPNILKEPLTGRQEAQKRAEKFAKHSLDFMAEANGNIPAYIFSSDDDNLCVEVSKNGGHIIMMTKASHITNPTLDIDKASEYAADFLRSNGYENMQQTGYTTDGTVVHFAYAYKENEYTIYPDLIKVKIALNDGSICGFEANGFLCNHCERAIPKSVISIDEAVGKISKRVKIIKTNKACIPKENGTEAWCYEILASYNAKKFLVYINTETGSEEEILMLIEDSQGKMTI